jgi:hypothetical protein
MLAKTLSEIFFPFLFFVVASGWIQNPEVGTYHDHACIELTTGFMMGEGGACKDEHATRKTGRVWAIHSKENKYSRLRKL